MAKTKISWQGAAGQFSPGATCLNSPAWHSQPRLFRPASRQRRQRPAKISGSEIRPGRAAIEFVRVYGGEEVATVVASNIVCGPIEAALANGVLAHADETDDSHGPSRCLKRLPSQPPHHHI